MGTSALRITAPFCSNRLSQKSAKKPEKLGYDTLRHSNTYLTHGEKKVKNSLYIRFVNDCHRVSYFPLLFFLLSVCFNPRPCVRGDNTEKKSKNFSHIIRLMTIRLGDVNQDGVVSVFSIHTPIKGRQAVLFGQQTDGSRKPHRKGVLLPVLTQLQQSIQRFRCKRIQLFVQGFRLK